MLKEISFLYQRCFNYHIAARLRLAALYDRYVSFHRERLFFRGQPAENPLSDQNQLLHK
jgi:hypothetical protein